MYAAELPTWMARSFAFVFGATFGSFFNVCIYRWPRYMSVVSPPSHCPSCGAPVRASRNVPILGYIFLRGRAGCCGTKLTIRYPLVELLSALLAVAIVERFIVHAPSGAELGTATLRSLAYFAFAGGLVIATFVDLEWLAIPDEVSLPGAALGLLVCGSGLGVVSAEESALGAAGGFLFVQLVFVWSYARLTGRPGMGEGDPKLLFMIGAFIGWRGVLFSVVAGAMQGLVAALASFATGSRLTPEPAADTFESWSQAELVDYLRNLFARRPEIAEEERSLFGEVDAPPVADVASPNDAADETDAPVVGDEQPVAAPDEEPAEADEEEAASEAPKIPFGPFLALGALEFFFFGEQIVDAYLGLFE